MTTKILAIDDSRTIRAILSDALKRAGYHVVTAIDGQDGLSKFRTERPDVVITDINMPKMDGFGVIETLRSLQGSEHVPVLVFTSESSAQAKERARLAGATGWINKPMQESSLLSILRRVAG